MKLEDQVCSLELAKRLMELGVKQESVYVWSLDVVDGYQLVFRENQEPDIGPNDCSAFTVAELGEMLPPDTPSDKASPIKFRCWQMVSEDGDETHWDEFCADDNFSPEIVNGETEAAARAKMLIYLIENNQAKSPVGLSGQTDSDTLGAEEK